MFPNGPPENTLLVITGHIAFKPGSVCLIRGCGYCNIIAEWETRQHNRAAWAPRMYIYIIYMSVTLSVCLGPRGSFYM